MNEALTAEEKESQLASHSRFKKIFYSLFTGGLLAGSIGWYILVQVDVFAATGLFALLTFLYGNYSIYLMCVFDGMLREQACQLKAYFPSVKTYGSKPFTVIIQICIFSLVMRDCFVKFPLQIWADGKSYD